MPGTDPAIAVHIACNATPPWPVGSAIEFIATGDDGIQNGTTDQSKYLFKFVLDGSTVKNWASDNYYYLPLETTVGDHSVVVSCSTDSGATTDATSTFTFRVATGSYPATGEKRYTCNGVLNISGTAGSMLSQLLESMDGNAVYSQGVWEIWSGSPKTAESDVIDESWLNGNISFNVGSNKNSLINTAKGTFVDPNDHWASTGFPTVQIQDYVDADLEELTLDLTLNFTTSGFMAQRLARIKMERSRRGMSVNYPCNMKALGVKVNEVRRVNNSLLGWVAKEFRVLDWNFAPNGGINLTLGEEDASIYNVSSADLQPLPLPFHTALPSPWRVSAPTALTATETLKTLSNGNGYFTQVSLSWVPADATANKYLVYMDGTLVDQQLEPYSVLMDISEGVHTFGVIAVNTLGTKSLTTVLEYNVLGKTAPPADVTGLQAELTRGQMRIYWNANADVDLAGYEIQIGTTWDDPANKVLVQGYAGTSYAWTPDRTGVISILAKAIDTSGNYSTAATRLDYSISGPGAVATLTQQVIDNIVELKWSAASAGSFPIDYYELWKGNDFATAELLGRKYSTFDLLQESVAGTYKYWIRAVDVAGLAGTETGVYAAVNQPPDYVLIDTQNLVFSECTMVNALVENDQVVLPINTTITFEDHFINNPDTTLEPWASPQDQIDDGYLLYGQPGPASASIERVIDYGALIPSSKLTMSVTRTTLAGNVTFTPELLVSTDDSSYTSLGNVYESAANNFRYAKYRLVATTADGGMASVQQINTKLDVKQKTFVTNTVNVTDTVSDGTEVTFASLGIAPVDITGIVAEAPYTGNATNDPIKALINFVDAANPTSFKVLCWNKSGTRVACNGVTVTIRYI